MKQSLVGLWMHADHLGASAGRTKARIWSSAASTIQTAVHAGAGAQCRFDLTKLNPQPANLCLEIAPTDEHRQSVGSPVGKVSGTN